MTIVWGVILAVLLCQFKKRLFRVDKLRYNIEEQIKRIGVYYMCIDDLPL